MNSFSYVERARSLDGLSQHTFDLCVIGGGIVGAAVARDAALRGWKVLLVEKDDFAAGTSSKSSKLIHGGVRYLEHGEFALVFEATRERALLWKLAPDLVTPLAFLFPAYKQSRVPLWKLNLGLWLYDVLALFRMPSLHRRYDKARTLREEPALRGQDLNGAIFYWDGLTDDALLTLANIVDARTAGAECLARTSCTGIDWATPSAKEPTLHTIRLRDTLHGRELTARARTVVSATGPWSDQLLKDFGKARAPLLKTTRGSHIVVSRERLPVKHAVVMTHPRDGRVLFVIPWENVSVVGTTDLFDATGPDEVKISPDEVHYLLEAANEFFPSCRLEQKDVWSAWAGLRPLLAPPSESSAAAVSREHHIEWIEPGLCLIAGGKLTTHREMAEQVVERLFQETAHWKFPPGPGFRPTVTHERPLPRLSGGAARFKQPTILAAADILEICRTEMVLDLEDLFVRRTGLYYRLPDNGESLVNAWAEPLKKFFGWSNADWKREVEAYATYVDTQVREPLGRPRFAR